MLSARPVLRSAVRSVATASRTLRVVSIESNRNVTSKIYHKMDATEEGMEDPHGG